MDHDDVLDHALDQGEPQYRSPNSLRDRHRNLDKLVALALKTNEDPLVLAADAGVSPSALLRALPKSYLKQFVPNADSLSISEVMLQLASAHALDVAVVSVVGAELDARTMVSMAKDVLDRASVVGHKAPQITAKLTLDDKSLAKLAELERSLLSSLGPNPTPRTIPEAFSSFHRVSNGQSEEERLLSSHEGWAGPTHPQVRDLDFDKD